MKAAVLREVGKPLQIEDVQINKPGPHEVLIRTVAAGLCHSDLHFMEGSYPHPLPAVLGHESAGIVEQVGSEVRTVKVGDHVITCLSAYCGHCESCLTGHLSLCVSPDTKRGADEEPRLTTAAGPMIQFLNLSSFAEYMLIHEHACVAIRKDMPLDRAALIGCSVMTGVGAAMHTSSVRPGETVAVIGCGGVGIAAVAGAALAGSSPIIAIDIDAKKLEKAKELGATHTIDSSTTDPVEAVKEICAEYYDGADGADIVVEAVGRPETWKQAFYARDLAGTVVLVGVPTPDMQIPEIPLIDVFGRGGSLKSSWYGDCLPSRDFPMLVDLYRQGRLDLDAFVTEEIGIDDVEAAFAAMHHGGVLRSVVVL